MALFVFKSTELRELRHETTRQVSRVLRMADRRKYVQMQVSRQVIKILSYLMCKGKHRCQTAT